MITVEQEREKYRRMWTEVDGYRSFSPGEKLVPMFLEMADWNPGDSLIDLGCGPGRAGLALAKAGLHVFLFDITEEAPDKEARGLPFIESCLWDLSRVPQFDWAYCCDVLEHIPPEHVDATLDNIKIAHRKGAFLQIALSADGYGSRIGETLHLTVRPAEWWKAKIAERWKSPQYRDEGWHLIVLTGERI